MRIEVALEWFLNPDHLPLIVGVHEGLFAAQGLEVALEVPDDHYDGMAGVTEGTVAFAVNEPLHMLDVARPGLRACGCFFETEGGVLLHRRAVDALFAGERVRIASPVAGEATDAIARLILRRWAQARGRAVADAQVAIEAAGFHHLDNMASGYDGAWLCFANFEGVQARLSGLDAEFVTARDAGLPNFSALELFTSADFLRDHPSVVDRFRAVLDAAVERLSGDVAYAQSAWREHGGEPPTPLADAIVADTCTRFVRPVRPDPERWRPLFEAFSHLGLSAVDAAGYEALYAGPGD